MLLKAAIKLTFLIALGITAGLKLNLALHFNLTTVWVVTPIEGAKILFKEMLSLIYLISENKYGNLVIHGSARSMENNNEG